MLKAWMGFVLAALACVATPAAAQTLEPADLPGMCVTISPHEGSISTPCDKSPAQTFELPRDAPGPIRYGEACLAPRGEGYYPQLHPETCDGSPAQTWTIADGAIRNGAGRCLALLGQSSRSGERVYGAHCPTMVDPHPWAVVPLDREIYEQVRGRLRWVAQPELCLTMIEQGSFMGLAPCAETQAMRQVFSFDRHDPSQFRMMSGCLTSFRAGGSLRTADCYVARDKTWMLQDGSLLSNLEGHCVEARMEGERWVARIAQCVVRPEQSWTFEAME